MDEPLTRDEIIALIEEACQKLLYAPRPIAPPPPIVLEDDEKIATVTFHGIDENGGQVWDVTEEYKQPMKTLQVTFQTEQEAP